MKQFIRKALVDCSDQSTFCFSITCIECGTVWKSTPVGFSGIKMKSASESKNIISKVLYQREHEKAYEKALNEAMNDFNLCPLCKRLVCNRCFIMCEDLDMCRTCGEYLEEKGVSVFEEEDISKGRKNHG